MMDDRTKKALESAAEYLMSLDADALRSKIDGVHDGLVYHAVVDNAFLAFSSRLYSRDDTPVGSHAVVEKSPSVEVADAEHAEYRRVASKVVEVPADAVVAVHHGTEFPQWPTAA
jgi:hypothetical protein